MADLALVLFLPWFLVLSALFLLFPRTHGGAARRGFDLAAIALALVLSIVAMRWAYASADLSHGNMWRQVLATLAAYGAFLVALGLAWALRSALFRPR
jgi:hypothetical protein